jgi:hypothetical protein
MEDLARLIYFLKNNNNIIKQYCFIKKKKVNIDFEFRTDFIGYIRFSDQYIFHLI